MSNVNTKSNVRTIAVTGMLSAVAVVLMYQAIIPSMKSIMQCLICFNLPFTIVKGLIDVGISMLIYKPLSPLLKGKH